jgi:ankyrin repeat protein
VASGKAELVRELVADEGVDVVDAATGYTPLQLACSCDSKEMVDLLLALGAMRAPPYCRACCASVAPAWPLAAPVAHADCARCVV